MQEPVETSEILAFAKAVDAKSLSRAATELGIPRATLGRRLSRLEERLGVRLLRRTTRSLALTDAGDAFYLHARLVLDAVQQAEASVSRKEGEVRGPLRVSMPPLTNPSFGAMIRAFVRRHPAVQLQLHFSTQHVDMQRDGYDVALRASTQLDPGLVARTLARTPIIAVASKAYLAAHGTPRNARDLRAHRLLLGFARGELPQTHWPLLDGTKVQVDGALSSSDIFFLASAAIDDVGIALLPLQLVAPALEKGKLVHVLPGVVGADTRIAVVYVEREFVPPQVRAFVDAIVAWAPEGFAKEVEGTCSTDALRKTKPRKKRL